jgi:hypothetical protein
MLEFGNDIHADHQLSQGCRPFEIMNTPCTIFSSPPSDRDTEWYRWARNPIGAEALCKAGQAISHRPASEIFLVEDTGADIQ